MDFEAMIKPAASVLASLITALYSLRVFYNYWSLWTPPEESTQEILGKRPAEAGREFGGKNREVAYIAVCLASDSFRSNQLRSDSLRLIQSPS